MNDSPLRTRLLLALVASMMGLSVRAVTGDEPGTPKLVVGIVVDDLREDYLNLLRQHFAKGGFNRLIEHGVLLQNVDYGPNIDAAAATAMLYTGAAPSVNGINADEVFDRATLVPVPIFADDQTVGNYTTQTLSPKALLTSTLADELRISGGGMTYAYAIAPDPSQAMIMAGHAGNCGVWINDANDYWATTTHYRDVPAPVTKRNRVHHLSGRIDSATWMPVQPAVKYSVIPKHLTKDVFKYTFTQKGPDRMHSFKNSPFVNSEITDLAIAHIEECDLGKHDGTDIISLAYTLEPFAYGKDADNRYELVDAYYRLDNDLEKLFSVIDKKVGLPNTLIFVASTPAVPRSRRDDERWQIPYGEFSTRKAMSLLNLYLIALHGNGNWVNGYHNGEFFLNQDLIKQESKDLSLIRQQAAAFLIQMAGVQSAWSLDDILNNRVGAISEPMKRNTSIDHAGDVRIAVLPGWQILDDYNYPSAKPHQVARQVATTAPMLIMAPGLAPKTIGATVDARAVAPTLSRILRIRSPNGAPLPAIPLF